MKHETWNKKHENFEKRCSLGREQGRDLKCIHSKISIALYFMILNRMFCEFWLQNAVRNLVLPTHTPNPHVPCPSSLHSFQISKPFLPTSASICLIIISSTAIDVCDHLNDDKGQFIPKEGIWFFHQRQAGKLAGQVQREGRRRKRQ